MNFRQRIGVAWRLLRPFTLTASIVPVLVGSGLAVNRRHFHFGLFFSFLIASILIQAATNMFNEYFDYKRGLDTKEMVGIAGTIVHDGISPGKVLLTAWTFIAISVVLGVYICVSTTWWIAVVGIACLAVAYFYSGGPKPLAYTPFGELAASIAMGPVIVLLAYYIQTSQVTGRAIFVSIPIGLLIGAILLGNNIRDMDQDKLGGRRTVAILLGRQWGRVLFASVFALTYVVVLALIAAQVLTPWALVVLLTVPTATYVTKLFFRFSEPSKLHPAVKGTAVLLFRFGTLMFAALVVGVWLPL
ncbi:1,4-dihydroxy-2-naphthoate polyprenyltransferase [Alicyclobacillus tolerans]|uniref:1,4-dihydroxy-2-naphthoate polyprenyltransferase n=1 Tax=Alicyclobacillus tolerans TaxID=90970 RepID=UPI001F0053B1|nr:1,4-dihydroxy-2-naphthoate polyprenyltransferase [Alicyclobacillus tolerans]MCF8563417.1 1,4-dihydroxy-2-naphthoate polyprenyltransferase [Alicyclobacillus tolerans]